MKLILRLFVIVAFIGILVLVIAYARGYRLDFNNKALSSTGIIAVSAYPKAAKVYLNDELKGVTDLNMPSLLPGNYKVEVKKDGYTTWRKNITLKGELVESLDVLLFPLNPSLTPLTNLGITHAIAIGQTDRYLLFSQNDSVEKDGIYVFDPSKRAISFLPPLKLIVLKSNLPAELDFREITVNFSPDFKEAIVDFNATASYLLTLDDLNSQPLDVTNSKETLLLAWQKEKQQEIAKIFETFPKEIGKIATDSFQVVAFSPDKTKILYQAKNNFVLPLAITPPMIAANQTPEARTLEKDFLYVYDKKEDKNFLISNFKPASRGEFQISNSILWYYDSQHLVINEEKKITVIDYDGQNKQTVYSGPFENYFLGTTTDGTLLVLTNLNGQINPLPDIYAVGIR